MKNRAPAFSCSGIVIVCSAPRKLYALDDIALWLAGHTIWSNGSAHSSKYPLHPLRASLARGDFVVTAATEATADAVMAVTATIVTPTITTHRARNPRIVWSVRSTPPARRQITTPM